MVSGQHRKRFLILCHTKEFKSDFAFEDVSTFLDAQKVTGNSFNCYKYPKVTKTINKKKTTTINLI